jgi:hypothetical protein
MANGIYRSVEELHANEFEELRGALFYSMKDEQGDKCKYKSPTEIPYSVVKENYLGISFVDDDFFCNLIR